MQPGKRGKTRFLNRQRLFRMFGAVAAFERPFQQITGLKKNINILHALSHHY
jgi:hypothetical protein